MSHCRTLRRHISTQRCQNRRYRSTDIRAKDKRTCEIESYPTFRTHYQCNGECSRRRLYHHSEQNAHRKEYQYGCETKRRILPEECKHLRITLQIRNIGRDHIQTHEQECKAYKEFAY